MQIIIDKLKNQQRLTYDEALRLYDLDLFTLGKYANKIHKLTVPAHPFRLNAHDKRKRIGYDRGQYRHYYRIGSRQCR